MLPPFMNLKNYIWNDSVSSQNVKALYRFILGHLQGMPLQIPEYSVFCRRSPCGWPKHWSFIILQNHSFKFRCTGGEKLCFLFLCHVNLFDHACRAFGEDKNPLGKDDGFADAMGYQDSRPFLLFLNPLSGFHQ